MRLWQSGTPACQSHQSDKVSKSQIAPNLRSAPALVVEFLSSEHRSDFRVQQRSVCPQQITARFSSVRRNYRREPDAFRLRPRRRAELVARPEITFVHSELPCALWQQHVAEVVALLCACAARCVFVLAPIFDTILGAFLNFETNLQHL